MVALIALYVLSFMYIGSWRRLWLALASVALVALDLFAYYANVGGARLLFLLPLLFTWYFKARWAAPMSIYYLSRGVVDLYFPQLVGLAPYFEWGWALMPLLAGARLSKKAVLLAALAALFVAASVYYTGMVLVFGLGLVQTWLFPLAVFTSLASRSPVYLFSLLVGPQVQLSVHYLVLAVSVGYVSSGELKR